MEMRCFGSYEANCVPVVFFRLLEATVEQQMWSQAGSTAFESLLKLCSDAEMRQIAGETVAIMTETPEKKEEIWGNVWKLARNCSLFAKLNPHSPFSFDPLCQTGDFALNIIGTRLTSKLPTLEVTLYQHQRVLFLLYSAFSKDSFLDYPCGHFCIKYDYYRYLQQMLGGRAVSREEMGGMGLKCNCGEDIGEAIYQSTCEKETFPAKTEQKGFRRGNFCGICDRESKNLLPKACSSHSTCDICAIKHYMTVDYEHAPCCGQKQSDLDLALFRKAVETEYAWVMSWLALVKHDKKVRIFVELVKPCKICEKNYTLPHIQEICKECRENRQYTIPRPSLATGIRHVSPAPAAQRVCPKCQRNVISDIFNEKCGNCLRKIETVKPIIPASLPHPPPSDKGGLRQGKLHLQAVSPGVKGSNVQGRNPAQGYGVDQGSLSRSAPGEVDVPENPIVQGRKQTYPEEEKQVGSGQATESLFEQQFRKAGQFPPLVDEYAAPAAWKMCSRCQRSAKLDIVEGICRECRQKEEERPEPRAPTQVPRAILQNPSGVLQSQSEHHLKQPKPYTKEVVARLGFPGKKPEPKDPSVLDSPHESPLAQEGPGKHKPPIGRYDQHDVETAETQEDGAPNRRMQGGTGRAQPVLLPQDYDDMEADQIVQKPHGADRESDMEVDEESKVEPSKGSPKGGKGRKRPAIAQIPMNEEPIGGPLPQNTNCMVCQAKYTSEDIPYFCPQACRCRRCVVEGLFGHKTRICKHCNKAVSQEAWEMIIRDKGRCHVCGIVVGTEEIEINSPCTICYQCVKTIPEKYLRKEKGQCPTHTSNIFDVDSGYYREFRLKLKFSTSACCSFATARDTRLDCRHYVCATHQEHLKSCRNCHAANKTS